MKPSNIDEENSLKRCSTPSAPREMQVNGKYMILFTPGRMTIIRNANEYETSAGVNSISVLVLFLLL